MIFIFISFEGGRKFALLFWLEEFQYRTFNTAYSIQNKRGEPLKPNLLLSKPPQRSASKSNITLKQQCERNARVGLLCESQAIDSIAHQSLRQNYGIGWNSRSGKKRLNSIKMPAVMNIQTVSMTGARERYFRKFCIG